METLSAVFCFVLIQVVAAQAPPSLYPRPTESRDVISLDGIWDFALVPNVINEHGRAEAIPGEIIPMPVPASYNDITEDRLVRDHVGNVIYERRFIVPSSWGPNRRVWIRFGSVCYSAKVYINSELVVEHEIGHLPFAADITSVVNIGGADNTIVVVVSNILLQDTIPQGSVSETTVGNITKLMQSYTFDFFNYAGIDRSVYIYSTPVAYIQDLDTKTTVNIANKTGTLEYSIDYVSDGKSVECTASLFDRDSQEVGNATGCSNSITAADPNLWWPYLMDPEPGYLYNLKVTIISGGVKDVYNQLIGFRQISWNDTSVTINGKPIYIRGFGRHEDSNVRGKGLDLALIVKDHSLIKWIGANAYRTSHYPYAEEIMDMADKLGIMIIDECPSVNTDAFSDDLLKNHKNSLTELIQRDKNRPSVIFWSIANEPVNTKTEAGPYFEQIIAHVRSMDTSRPVTLAAASDYNTDQNAQFLDVIMVNRYNSWYTDTGRTEVITENLVNDLQKWRDTFNKPILVSEYGADTIPGLHILPEYVWSEEYQTKMMEETFKAFDILRERGWFMGEMIWNFADFMTAQTITRVNGNRKGIFTRERQPKASAHLLRKRYWGLAGNMDNVDLPEDLFEYVLMFSGTSSYTWKEQNPYARLPYISKRGNLKNIMADIVQKSINPRSASTGTNLGINIVLSAVAFMLNFLLLWPFL